MGRASRVTMISPSHRKDLSASGHRWRMSRTLMVFIPDKANMFHGRALTSLTPRAHVKLMTTYSVFPIA